MKAVIYISGKIGKDTTLVDVIRQYKSYEDPTEVLAIIDSFGGDKEIGDSIYDFFEGLKAEIPVNTYAKKAYSIAAKIFAVGQERIVDDKDKALMIHFAWAKPKRGGDAEFFETIAEQLREMEDEFASFYSSFLDVDEETVRNLLDKETFISGSEAVDLNFATELKVAAEAVAEYDFLNSNINIKKMTEKKKTKSKGQLLIEAMASFVGIEIETKQDVEIVAELTLQDSNGTDIVFPDLESGDTPKVGDAATMDGSAIADGSYIMPSLEEATVVFVDGKISEINPKEEVEETETEIEAAEKAKQTKTEVNAEELKEVFTYSVTATNTSFEVGETLMFEGWDGGEDYAASAGEFRMSDGSKIVTDASGIIVSKEAAETAEPTLEAEASFDGLLEKVTDKVKTEINAEYEAKFEKQTKEIKALKKQLGSKEIEVNAEEIPEINTKTKGSRASQILAAANKLK